MTFDLALSPKRVGSLAHSARYACNAAGRGGGFSRIPDQPGSGPAGGRQAEAGGRADVAGAAGGVALRFAHGIAARGGRAGIKPGYWPAWPRERRTGARGDRGGRGTAHLLGGTRATAARAASGCPAADRAARLGDGR